MKIRMIPDLVSGFQDSEDYNSSHIATATLEPEFGSETHHYEELIECCTRKGLRLKIGDSVELGYDTQENELYRKGGFFRICGILRSHASQEITLRGVRMKRSRCLQGLLPHQLNELVMVVDIRTNDAKDPDPFTAGLETIGLEEVYKKRKVILTNQPFPKCSFREHTPFDSYGTHAEEHKFEISCSSELVCRWIAVYWYDRLKRRPYKKVLRRMTEGESDLDAAISDSWLRYEFRGGDVSPEGNLTFGDGFCGCGGVSEGAAQAGLKVVWGFDNDPKAYESYQLNRPGTEPFLCDVHDFRALLDDDLRVDVVHLSPPCQAMSAANWSVGFKDPGSEGAQRDEMNQAALICIASIVEKTKARVVTIEQTSGISSHHPNWLRALIGQFTSIGYSCRWRIIDCADYGVPQHRKRLFLMASCPGGVLPDFPPPTHGNGPGLRPYATIADCISGVNDSHRNHHPRPKRSSPPYSSHTQLRGIITCNGTDAIHPSGQRAFTVRELACLQTLPKDFRFGPGQNEATIKRQIGNLVPVTVARAMMSHIKETLERDDEDWAEISGHNMGR